jgi:hypothetical protein
VAGVLVALLELWHPINPKASIATSVAAVSSERTDGRFCTEERASFDGSLSMAFDTAVGSSHETGLHAILAVRETHDKTGIWAREKR